MSARNEYFLQLKDIRDLNNSYEKGTLWKSKGNDYVTVGEPIKLELYHSPSNINNLAHGNITREYDSSEFHHIDNLEFYLLLSIRENCLRLKVYFDEEWLSEGKNMSVLDEVVILKLGNDINYSGTIRYKGPTCPPSKAIFFGIELDHEFAGQGTTDGFFRGHQYFDCEDDCGVFRNLGYIRLKNKKEKLHKQIPPKTDISFPIATNISPEMHYRKQKLPETFKSLSGSDDENTEKEEQILKVGEKVYWWSDSGREPAIVKWVGYLPDGGEELVAGVEFFNPIGSGSGKYKQWKLFHAKAGHASLIPLLGLIKADDSEDLCGIKSKCEIGFEKMMLAGVEPVGFFRPLCKSGLSAVIKPYIKLRQPELKQEEYELNVEESQSKVKSDEDQTASFSRQSQFSREKHSELQKTGGICKPVIVTSDSIKELCGEQKGIEVVTGHGDLEAIIYALFSFNQTFDAEFSKELSLSQITTSIMLKDQLRSIVNKLRSKYFVRKTVTFLFAQNLAHFPMDVSKGHELDDVFFHLIQSCFASLRNNINVTVLWSNVGISSVQQALEKSCCPSLFLQNFSSIEIYVVFNWNSSNKCVPSAFINPQKIIFSCCKCNISISDPDKFLGVKTIKGFMCHECYREGSCRRAFYCCDCFDQFHSSETFTHHKKKLIDQNIDMDAQFLKVGAHYSKSYVNPRYKPEKLQRVGSFEHKIFQTTEELKTDIPRRMELFAVISEIHGNGYRTFVKTGHGENALWLGYEATPTCRVDIFPEFMDFLAGYLTSPSGSFSGILHEMVNNMICCFYRPVGSSEKR